MANGDIVSATFPLTVDPNAVASSSVTTQLTILFPVATYTLIHTEVIFDTGSKTKATVVVIAQDIS